LIKAIEEDKTIPFIVTYGDTTYTFQLDGKGYQEAMKERRGN
jgi:hypothetical protein